MIQATIKASANIPNFSKVPIALNNQDRREAGSGDDAPGRWGTSLIVQLNGQLALQSVIDAVLDD
jgi:hypothetical protein